MSTFQEIKQGDKDIRKFLEIIGLLKCIFYLPLPDKLPERPMMSDIENVKTYQRKFVKTANIKRGIYYISFSSVTFAKDSPVGFNPIKREISKFDIKGLVIAIRICKPNGTRANRLIMIGTAPAPSNIKEMVIFPCMIKDGVVVPSGDPQSAMDYFSELEADEKIISALSEADICTKPQYDDYIDGSYLDE
tara:strand:- start:2532 stop:3104 length:573 start_codon:yes stop_codon:yes gene_type:complete